MRADFASKYPSQGATLDGFDVNAILALQTNRTCTTYSETAWGGVSGFSGRNWATYIDYTPTYKPCPGPYRLEFYAKSSYADPAPAQLEVEVNGAWLPPVLVLGPAANG